MHLFLIKEERRLVPIESSASLNGFIPKAAKSFIKNESDKIIDVLVTSVHHLPLFFFQEKEKSFRREGGSDFA